MNPEIREQLNILISRFEELRKLYEREIASEEVPKRLRSVTEDILVGSNRLLDKIVNDFFEKKVFPSMSTGDVKKFEKQVMFPVREKREDLKQDFKRQGLQDAELDFPAFFFLVEKSQPYNIGLEWIKALRELSNLSHRRLIPQKKKKIAHVEIGQNILIVTESMIMKNATINGIPGQNIIIEKGNVRGNLDARLNARVDINIFYMIENTNYDVISLCRNVLTGISELISDFEKLY